MKNIKIIMAAVLFFSCEASKLSNKSVIDNTTNAKGVIVLPCNKLNDTLQYIQCVRESKEKYLNKPLRNLLNDLKFPAKSYTFGISNSRVTVPGIFLSFNDNKTTIDKMEQAKGQKNPLQFYITFNPPIEGADVLSNVDIKDRNWGKAQKDYFGKLIIRNLQ